MSSNLRVKSEHTNNYRLNEQLYVIQLFAKLLYEHDASLYEHSVRVSRYAYTLALLSSLPSHLAVDIAVGGFLHDIGKLEISKEILNKSQPLTQMEWEKLKNHPLLGTQLLEPFSHLFPSSVFQIINSHHERLDATGYPQQLVADKIPTEVRIVTIADCYDAMTRNRSYSKAITKNEAINELLLHSGVQFDIQLVNLFIHFLKKESPLLKLPFHLNRQSS